MIYKVSILDLVLPIAIVGYIVLMVIAKFKKTTVKELWKGMMEMLRPREED